MKRITVTLPDDIWKSVAGEAADRNVPVAEIVREALRETTKWRPATPGDLSGLIGMFSAPGMTPARCIDDVLEREWADAIRGDR
jgi:hypothetical protein